MDPLPTTHRDQLPSVSRYELLVKIASGGMATVYVGRLTGAGGFRRLVAIKRAHAHLIEDPVFKRMLVAEARLASTIHHPNVVAVQDVEELDGELLLVMDYVEGAAFSELLSEAAIERMPLPAQSVVRVVLDACAGLHAAHELTDEDGKPLGLVHRDVSPQNILVGTDGIARLADFGIAKSSGHTASSAATATGVLKGKVAYMAPEYVERGIVLPQGDVFALGVVAWEALTRRRLFRGTNEVETLRLVLDARVEAPSKVAPWVGTALDRVLLKALARAPDDRYTTARDFAEALEAAARTEDLLGSHAQVGDHVRAFAGPGLEKRRALLRAHTDEASGVVPRPSGEVTEPLAVEGRSGGTALLTPGAAPSAPHLHDKEKSTLGSGVSALTVTEARALGAGSRSRPLRVAAVLVAVLGAALVAVLGLSRGASPRVEPVIAPVSAAGIEVKPAAVTSAIVSPAVASAAVSASALGATRPPPALTPATRPAARPAAAAPHTKPVASASPPAPTAAPPTTAAPPAAAESSPKRNRAPPNPYAPGP